MILVRRETTPEDIHGMRVAEGILTALGGMTSHAAVVARGMGVCAITGCGALKIDYDAGTATTDDGVVIKRGDVITLDGSAGDVMLGDIPKTEASASDDFQVLLSWADRHRRLQIRANAETEEDARTARELGAEGIGLCRTEHMFFDTERIREMRAMILAESPEERQASLDKLLAFQQQDMLELFKIMDGLPVTVRLLDPPLHEFLPHGDNEVAALAESLGKSPERIRSIVQDLSEVNPMLGFRGCRLSVVYPEITEMQVRAIVGAAIEASEQGCRPYPEIMIPLVVNVREVRLINDIIESVIREMMSQQGRSISYKIGTMMETPRACLGADRVAPAVEFMSFGTNDLTQMTYGFSRDDAGKFIPSYLDKKLIGADPFVSLDQRGVGRLVRMAIEDSAKRMKGIKYGICGEHGGDPLSIRYCPRDRPGLRFLQPLPGARCTHCGGSGERRESAAGRARGHLKSQNRVIRAESRLPVVSEDDLWGIRTCDSVSRTHLSSIPKRRAVRCRPPVSSSSTARSRSSGCSSTTPRECIWCLACASGWCSCR